MAKINSCAEWITECRNNQFNDRQISALVSLAKNPKTLSFIEKFTDLILTGPTQQLSYEIERNFGGRQTHVAEDAVTFIAEFCDKWTNGTKAGITDALNYISKRYMDENPYNVKWFAEIEKEKVREAVMELEKEDDRWGVFSEENYVDQDDNHYYSGIKTFVDEVSAVKNLNLENIEVLEQFGSVMPVPQKHSVLEYRTDVDDMPDYEGGFIFVETWKQYKLLARKLRKPFKFCFTDDEIFDNLKDDYRRCTNRGKWFYIDPVDAKDEDDGEEECQVIATPPVPENIKSLYDALKSGPGKSYYLHAKNRDKFFALVKRKNVKKNVKTDDAARPIPKRKQVPQEVEMTSLIKKVQKVVSKRMTPAVAGRELLDSAALDVARDKLVAGGGNSKISKMILEFHPVKRMPLAEFARGVYDLVVFRAQNVDGAEDLYEDAAVFCLCSVVGNFSIATEGGEHYVERSS